MVEQMENRLSKRSGLVHLIIGMLVFGSIWGLLEATLGGFLHMIIFPNKGAIMAGIGVALMSSALAIYRKPGMLFGIGVVAASFKLLDVWIFSLAITSVNIVNPAMAIVFESLAFSLMATFLVKRTENSSLVGMGGGALAGMLSAVSYVYFAIYVMHADRAGRVITTAGAFIANQGVVQAAFFAVLLPLGYLVGKKLVTKTSPVLARRSLYYATSVAIIVFCWGISAIALMSGL